MKIETYSFLVQKRRHKEEKRTDGGRGTRMGTLLVNYRVQNRCEPLPIV